jgi:mRNA-degrading endonuclease RelE of RelBE toxin-antitoxin system
VAGANFELRISEEALEQLRSLPAHLRRLIGRRLEALEASFAGDVRKLAGAADKYRLRVGNHRILFRLVGNRIQVYAVRDRKEAYD